MSPTQGMQLSCGMDVQTRSWVGSAESEGGDDAFLGVMQPLDTCAYDTLIEAFPTQILLYLGDVLCLCV